MNAKRAVSLLAAAVLAVAAMSGCKAKESESSAASTATTTAAAKTKINVAVIKGPSGIGMVNLMEASEGGFAANEYAFTTVSSPEEIVTKVSSGEADIATPPTNLAASLYKKTSGKVQMMAISTRGVLYLMENGDSVKSVADLKGKTIYTTGQGANPEFVLNYILKKNSLDPDKDVNIVFKTENDELATLLASGTAKIALVPEPVVTTVKAKKAELRVALDMTAEWDKISDGKSQLLMGCVIARKEFISQHPDAVTAFLKEYKASIEKATADLDATSALCEKYEIIPKAAVAKAALPRCGLTYLDGNAMMEQIKGYFDVLYAADPKSVGGALPDDAFYYNAQK